MTPRSIPGFLVAIALALAVAAPAQAQSTPRALSPAEARDLGRKPGGLTGKEAVELGWAFENGVARLERDYSRALYLYRGNDIMVARSPDGAAHLARLAAKIKALAAQGDPEATYALAMAYSEGYIPMKDGRAKALPMYIKAAEAGDLPAARQLIYIYSTGNYGPKDPKQELYWIQKLAARGSPTGYRQLGHLYADGGILPKDDARAVEAWRKGAVLDRSTATEQEASAIDDCRMLLGYFYRDGRGVARDPKQALSWFRQGPPRRAKSEIEKLLLANPALAEQEAETAAVPTPLEPVLSTLATAPVGPRYALVIGNAGYTGDLGRLANPLNDARLIAETLKGAGFQVEVVTDADQRTMKAAIKRLSQQLATAGSNATGLFYYAGHGAQAGGVNYLAPVNAVLKTEADLELEAVRADAALAQMREAGAHTAIMILDACRNMPLARSTRDGTRGFARMQTGGGAYIAYSTAPGETAADGSGGNSPFSLALARQIRNKGQPIEVMFRKVRAEVSETTKGAQTPWDTSSLADDFIFTP